MKKNYKNNDTCENTSKSREDYIISLMLDSIRDKVNCLQAELNNNGLDEVTKSKIIDVYKILCNE